MASDIRTEILAIGTELLTPLFQDTNSLFLIERLNDLGLPVSFKTVVGDNPNDLLESLKTALRRSHLIIAMGGLGPTEDDRTRELVAKVLKRKLVYEKTIQTRILERFRRRSIRMPSSNKKQCFVIDGSEVLDNAHGTAPGLWIEIGSRRLALLPGPPHEMKPMFDNYVRPKLEMLRKGFTLRRIFKITGLSESLMEDRIRGLYRKVPAGGSITTLAYPGELQIHLTLTGRRVRDAACRLLGFEELLAQKLGSYIYSRQGRALEETVAILLESQGRTLACAESCSGGLLSHRLTNVPGSSNYFLEGVVAYSNAAKIKILGLSHALINFYGAVSAPVAKAMARGILKKSGADFGLAITGIAGPSGGTAAKPVGLVYTSLAWKNRVDVEKNVFLGGRESIKFQSSQKALDMLRRHLLKNKGYNRLESPKDL